MRDPGKLIKAEKWWNEKAPLVLGLVYFLLAVSRPVLSVTRYLPALLAFVTAFVGVAGYGHVINDLADRKHDRAAGKHNTMQGKGALESAGIVLALMVLSWVPWLILPATRWTLPLVGLQLVLLTAYAVPPLRLKIRPVPGVVTDALYAYTMPVLITWTTWTALTRLAAPTQSHPALLALLIPWSFSVGLRGILNHQYGDAANDLCSGVTTFATRFGRSRTLWALSHIVLPLEMLCFALLTAAFTLELPLYVLGVAFFFCWRAFEVAYLQTPAAEGEPFEAGERFLQRYGYKFLSEFYALWFPAFMLLALVHRSLTYLPIAAVHCVLFKTGPGQIFRYDLGYLRGGFARMRRQHA